MLDMMAAHVAGKLVAATWFGAAAKTGMVEHAGTSVSESSSSAAAAAGRGRGPLQPVA